MGRCMTATLIHDEGAQRTLVYCNGQLEAVVPHDESWVQKLGALLEIADSAEEYVPIIEWAGWIPRTLEGLPLQVFAPVAADHPLSTARLARGERSS